MENLVRPQLGTNNTKEQAEDVFSMYKALDSNTNSIKVTVCIGIKSVSSTAPRKGSLNQTHPLGVLGYKGDLQ